MKRFGLVLLIVTVVIGFGVLAVSAESTDPLTAIVSIAGETTTAQPTGTREPTAMLTVNSAADTTDGVCEPLPGDCTLREAIALANANGAIDTILLDLPDGATEIVLTDELPSVSRGYVIKATLDDHAISGDDLYRIISVLDSGSLTLENLTLRKGSATNGGAIYSTGELTLIDALLEHNSASENGGAIYAVTSTLTIESSKFLSNTFSSVNGYAGGLYLRATEATITNSLFQSNRAVYHAEDLSGFGGAIVVKKSGSSELAGSLTISKTSFIGNEARRGGAFFDENGGSIISHSTFEGNRAVIGGAIHAGSFASDLLQIRDSMIVSNTAANDPSFITNGGGGVYVSQSHDVLIERSLIAYNTAPDGAGIYKDSDELTIRNTTITGNVATGEGGGIYSSCGRATTWVGCFTRLEHTTINANIGVGVFNGNPSSSQRSPDNIYMTHTLIAGHDLADCDGGGLIQLNTFNHIEDNSCNPAQSGNPQLGDLEGKAFPLFAGSPAIDVGDAAIVAAPATDIRGAGFPRISNNHVDIGAYEFQATCWATADNGAFVQAGDSAGVIRGAVALAGAGGSVKVAGYCPGVSGDNVLSISADITLTGGYSLTTFTAADWVTPMPNLHTTLDAENNGRVMEISGATTNASLANLSLINGTTTLFGGGILMNEGTLTATDLNILNNSAGAVRGGGGIFMDDGTLVATNVNIENNSAGEGAGIHMCDGILMATGLNIYNNNAEFGGGIRLDDGSATIEQSAVISNTASSSSGGGILVSGGILTATTINIEGNNSAQNGGGISIWPGASATIEQSTIVSNTSSFSGGGIYVSQGRLTASGLNIKGNRAQTNGGGISTRGNVSIERSTIISNTASTRDGGGIYVWQGAFTATDLTIQDNSAQISGGGISIEYDGSATIEQSTIISNTALTGDGGGIVMDGGKFIATLLTIENNIAQGGGGGIGIRAGDATIEQSDIISNVALTENGGGIFVDSADTFDAVNLNVHSNLATFGGGIYTTKTTASIKQSAITSNTVSEAGGGLGLGSGSVTVVNSTISGNDSTKLNKISGAGAYNDQGIAHFYNVTIAKNGSSQDHVGLEHEKGTTLLYNSLIVDNNGLAQCSGIGTSDASGDSIADDASCGNATVIAALNLPPLAYNYGSTLSHLPANDSGVFGAGNMTICNASPVSNVDQRGFARTKCDVGAIETGAAIPTAISMNGSEAAPQGVGLSLILGGGLLLLTWWRRDGLRDWR